MRKQGEEPHTQCAYTMKALTLLLGTAVFTPLGGSARVQWQCGQCWPDEEATRVVRVRHSYKPQHI